MTPDLTTRRTTDVEAWRDLMASRAADARHHREIERAAFLSRLKANERWAA
jgi:hypothetical protein